MSASAGRFARSALARATMFWAAYLIIVFITGLGRGLLPPSVGALPWAVACSILLMGLTGLLRHRERRSWADIGLGISRGSISRLLGGFALGVALYVAILVANSKLIAPIALDSQPTPPGSLLLLTTATYLALGMMEELGFRAYSLWTLHEAQGPWVSQAIVAAAFAGTHLVYGWALPTVLLGVLPSGILFGVAAWVTRGLALPFGIHVAMNLARWLTGEKEYPGFWKLAFADADQLALSTWAPLLGAAMTLTAAAVLAVAWHRPPPVPRMDA